jgi:hypothetical protein
MTENGSINYDISNCGKDCHVLIKFGTKYQELNEPEQEEAPAPRSEDDMDPKVFLANQSMLCLMIGAQRNENTSVQYECIFKTESYLLLARVDRMEAASLFSTSCIGCCRSSPLGCEAGGRMSEWSRGAAWWPRPRSLCTAAAAAWYVRAMYEQCPMVNLLNVRFFISLKTRRAFELGRRDSTTMVSASVMVYYTPDFKRKVRGDLIQYIDSLVGKANMAFSKTGIPLRIHAHCIEQLQYFSERYYTDAIKRRDAFTLYKGNIMI